MKESEWEKVPRDPLPKCCPTCGMKGVELSWGPNPYMLDVNSDWTPGWECDACLQQSADDI